MPEYIYRAVTEKGQIVRNRVEDVDRNMILLSIGVVFLTILFSISYLNNKIRYGLILGIVILLYYKREQIKEMLRMIKKNKN